MKPIVVSLAASHSFMPLVGLSTQIIKYFAGATMRLSFILSNKQTNKHKKGFKKSRGGGRKVGNFKLISLIRRDFMS